MNKLIEIQRELVVIKSQFNQFGNYSYRSCEDILLALKPLLVKHECTLTVYEKIHLMGEHVYIEAIAELSSKPSMTYTSTSFARDGITQKGMSAPQVTNSASSFAKKQALSNLFLIDDSAVIAPSAEEQREIEETEKKLKEDAAKAQEKRITDFLDEAEKNFKIAETMTELKPIFANMYNASKQLGQPVMDKLEGLYKTRKDEL